MSKLVKPRAKQCKKVLDNGRKCKAYAMANGLCRMHGGLNSRVSQARSSGLEVKRALSVAKQIEEVKNSLKITNGETFKHRYKTMLESEDLMSIRRDVAVVTTLLDLMMDQLNVSEFEGKDRIKLYESISKVVDSGSKIKERMLKLKSGYFDADSMKLVVTQILATLNEFKTKCNRVEGDVLSKKDVLKWLHESVMNIENAKVPRINQS